MCDSRLVSALLEYVRHHTHYGSRYRVSTCVHARVVCVFTWVRSSTFTHSLTVCMFGFFPSPPSSSYSHVIRLFGMDIFSCFSLHSADSLLNSLLNTKTISISSVSFHSLSSNHVRSVCSYHNLSTSCVYFEFNFQLNIRSRVLCALTECVL